MTPEGAKTTMTYTKREYNPISSNHELGLILETVMVHAERELGLNVTFHNSLDPQKYCVSSGYGIDNIFEYDNVSYGIECKNLKGYIGVGFGKEHIIKRYADLDVNRKITLVSKKELLSVPLRTLLSYLGFIIVDIGFQVSWYTFSKAIHILKRKLRSLLHIPLSVDCSVNNSIVYGDTKLGCNTVSTRVGYTSNTIVNRVLHIFTGGHYG